MPNHFRNFCIYFDEERFLKGRKTSQKKTKKNMLVCSLLAALYVCFCEVAEEIRFLRGILTRLYHIDLLNVTLDEVRFTFIFKLHLGGLVIRNIT
jgi:hypothetical protein